MLVQEILSEAKTQNYVFINPKNKKDPYSGEYVVLVQDEIPASKYLKKLNPGVYTHKELVKAAGLERSISYLKDQLQHEYNVPEISTGRIVTIDNSGRLTYIQHNKKKVIIGKKFTDYLLLNKYLIIEED